jgi:hypothetical protein
VTDSVLPTYSAFIEYRGRYYEGPGLTIPEFRVLDIRIVAETCIMTRDEAFKRMHATLKDILPVMDAVSLRAKNPAAKRMARVRAQQIRDVIEAADATDADTKS